MTGNQDQIRDIGDIPKYEADELREIVRKVHRKMLDEHIDKIVVRVYRDHHRPLSSTAFNVLLREIPKEDLEALYEEGLEAFLGDREPGEVDQKEATEYASKYRFVALSMYYPWLMARKKQAP